jgi:hypothetical protein
MATAAVRDDAKFLPRLLGLYLIIRTQAIKTPASAVKARQAIYSRGQEPRSSLPPFPAYAHFSTIIFRSPGKIGLSDDHAMSKTVSSAMVIRKFTLPATVAGNAGILEGSGKLSKHLGPKEARVPKTFPKL